MRLNAEVNNKQDAKSAAAEARADAAEKQQQDQNNALLQQQNEMLKKMGVNLQAEESDAGADSDPPDPTELKLYQKMLESGVAPHCKGKKGWAMIDCVDAATVEK